MGEPLEGIACGPNPLDHQTHIVKGKRTKRQRPQSPIPFSIAAHSHNNADAPSPTSSAEFGDSATEEEEDMANCLILLAQGQSLKPNYDRRNEETGFKFTSKRFLETTKNGNGKAGIYVYQCKTCDRTFPSFQALGGHRASHKKPKAVAAAAAAGSLLLSDDEEEIRLQFKNSVSSSLSLQLSNRPNLPKVHECSICGAEFASGQALGGHMRRHRGTIGGGGGGAASTALCLSSLSPDGFESHSRGEDQEVKRPGNVELCLDLDLNLPAPDDEFSFGSKQQRQPPAQPQESPLVLATAPALVDCHY